MFILREGDSVTLNVAKKPSTVMAQMAVLDWAGGYFQPATNSSTALAGILQHSVLTTDSDYADATQVPIQTLTDKTVWEANVFDESLILPTLVGTYVDLKDSLTLDLASSVYGQFLITAINTALGTVHGHFNASALYMNVGAGSGSGQNAIQYKDEGVNLGTAGSATSVDFVGAGVTATRVGAAVTVTIPTSGQTAVQYQDEGVNLGTSGTADTVNFVGAGVTATRVGNVVTATIPSGAGGLEVYGAFWQTVADVSGTIASNNGKAEFETPSSNNTAGDFTMIAGSGDITVNTTGVYEIEWEITCAEAGAMALYIGAALQTGTVFGTGAGTQNINGRSILSLTAGDVVSLRSDNCPAALTLQLAGTTDTAMIVAGITFKKLN